MDVNAGLPATEIYSLSISPDFSHDRTAFASSFGGGVFRSTDAGDTWHETNAGLPGLAVISIVISPDFRNDSTVFLGQDDNGVFKSTDAGTSWTSSNGDLPYPYYNYVKLSPDFPTDDTLFTAYSDVYQSRDGGATWSVLGALSWPIGVASLDVSADGQYLFAATNGESIFCMKLK